MRPGTFTGLGVVAFAAIVGAGCSTRIIDFTVISSKQIQLSIPDSARGGRVTGEDKKLYFLFPLGTPQLKDAVDRAIEKSGPGYDALIDGVVRYQGAFLIGKFGYIVEGTPVKMSLVKGASLELDDVLYHSSLEISNDEALARIAAKETSETRSAQAGTRP